MHYTIEYIVWRGFLVERSMFFADSQLTHGPIMPIFDSVQAIPPTDHVWKFERNSLSSSLKLIPSEKEVFGR